MRDMCISVHASCQVLMLGLKTCSTLRASYQEETRKDPCMLPLIYTAPAYIIPFVSVIVFSRVSEAIGIYWRRS